MKITNDAVQYFKREPAQVAFLRANTRTAAIVGTELPPTVTTATAANDSAKPAKAVEQGGQKTVPPGLERVLARLQATASPARNAGRANALATITRNIARYAETQAIAEPPVVAPLSPTLINTDGSTSATEASNESDPAPIDAVGSTIAAEMSGEPEPASIATTA